MKQQRQNTDPVFVHPQATSLALAASANDADPLTQPMLRLSADIPLSITGFASGVPGRVLWLTNVGASAITLTHEDALSAAENRITSPTAANLTLAADAAALLWYDDITQRWRPLAGAGPNGSGVAGQVAYWSAATTLTSDADFTFDGSQLALAVAGSAGGLLVGADVQWYRNAANEWRTPDSAVIDSTLYVGSNKGYNLTATVTGLVNQGNLDVSSVAGKESGFAVTMTAPATFDADLIIRAVSGATSSVLTLRRNSDGVSKLFNLTGVNEVSFDDDTSNAYMFKLDTGLVTVFNEQGLDIDHRFEGDTQASLLHLDAGNDRIGIRTAAPGAVLDIADSHAATTPIIIASQASTGDAALRFALAATISYVIGIDNSASDVFQIAVAASGTAVLGTGPLLTLDGTQQFLGFRTAAPANLIDIVSDSATAANRQTAWNHYTADAVSHALLFNKSRNATAGSHTIVQSGDALGQFQGRGSNGTTFDPAAAIRFVVDGTPGASADMPGRIELMTSADGSATLTTRLTIGQNGRLEHAGTSATLIGFRGVAAVAATTFTQTYATTSNTHAATTSLAAPAGGTGTAAGGYDTAGNRNLMITSQNAIRTDLDNLKQFVNGIADALQAMGIAF